MTNEEQEENKDIRSYIYIEFEDATSIATTQFNINGVSPFQLFAFAKYLEMKGEQLLMQLEMQQVRVRQEEAERKKIIVPRPNIEIKKH